MAKDTGIKPEKIAFEDESEYSEEQALGFPAYWKGSVGRKFVAQVIHLDDSDPEFQRWVFLAQHDTVCARGPVDEAEEVIVKKGEYFSTSAYAMIGNADSARGLHQYIGEVVKLEVTGEQDTGQPSKMMVFKLSVTKETQAKILARRQARVEAQFGLNGKSLAKVSEPKPVSAGA